MANEWEDSFFREPEENRDFLKELSSENFDEIEQKNPLQKIDDELIELRLKTLPLEEKLKMGPSFARDRASKSQDKNSQFGISVLENWDQILEPEMLNLESLRLDTGRLELQLEDQNVIFEEKKLATQARTEINAEWHDKKTAARQISEIYDLRLKIEEIQAQLKRQVDLLVREKNKLQTEFDEEKRAKESALAENEKIKIQVAEIAPLRLKITELEEKIKELLVLSKQEERKLQVTLENEKQAKEAALSENASLKAAAQVSKYRLSELDALKLKALELEKELNEKTDFINQKQHEIEGEIEARQKIENPSSVILAELAKSKNELLLLERENSTIKKNLEEIRNKITEGPRLRIKETTPFSEILDIPQAAELRPEPLEDAPSPISMDSSIEPKWMKALEGIRDPLSSAQSRIKQLATLRLPEGPRAVLSLAVGSLAQAADTIKMIGDFLGEAAPPGIPGHIESAIDPSLNAWESAFRRKHISIVRHIQTGLPMVVMNQDSFRTAIYQILRNAYEAMPKGGTLKINLEEDKTTGEIRLIFSDTGPGFSIAALSQIFVPFATLRPGHLGLGLSLAQRILRRYGGDVEAANLEPKGAVVTLRFALASTDSIPPLTEEK